MSYKFSRDIGYQPWGVTNPWVFANFGQPQRARGYVSPMIFQTQEPHLRDPYLGGLGALPMMAARMMAVPAKATATAARTAAHRMAAAVAPMFTAAHTTASRHAAAPTFLAARSVAARHAATAATAAHMAARRGAVTPEAAIRYARAANRAVARREALQRQCRAAGMGADPAPTDEVHVTAQSVLDEELARSRRMEIVSVASLVLGVASYILFRRAMMKKNTGGRRRRHHRRRS